MESTRRRMIAGPVGALAPAWSGWLYLARATMAVTDRYALLNGAVSPPLVELGCIVANGSSGRCAATVHLALDLPDEATRTATQEVRPYGGNSDQAYVALEFPDRAVEKLADATARFLVTDCRRLGVILPVPVGCAEGVIRESVER